MGKGPVKSNLKDTVKAWPRVKPERDDGTYNRNTKMRVVKTTVAGGKFD